MWLAAGAILVVLGVLVWRIRRDEGGAVAQGHVVQVTPREEHRPLPPSHEDAELDELPDSTRPAPEQLRVRVLRRLPHDPEAFTQGLEVHPDGRLFESTGLNGRSSLREVTLESGQVLRRREVDAAYFAEGITLVGDRVIQLTWQDGVAFEYDLATFEPRRELHYEGEGWGLCLDTRGNRLIMSDGSSTLSFRDPATFEERGTVRVTRQGRGQRMLNELECVDGVVYANVWQTEELVRIDPETGHVTAVINARGLLTQQDSLGADVLNGIAYLPASQHFLITGKQWPAMFEVVFEPASSN